MGMQSVITHPEFFAGYVAKHGKAYHAENGAYYVAWLGGEDERLHEVVQSFLSRQDVGSVDAFPREKPVVYRLKAGGVKGSLSPRGGLEKVLVATPQGWEKARALFTLEARFVPKGSVYAYVPPLEMELEMGAALVEAMMSGIDFF